jgi:hypothetical protein
VSELSKEVRIFFWCKEVGSRILFYRVLWIEISRESAAGSIKHRWFELHEIVYMLYEALKVTNMEKRFFATCDSTASQRSPLSTTRDKSLRVNKWLFPSAVFYLVRIHAEGTEYF